jgi:putative transcriptional regulator
VPPGESLPDALHVGYHIALHVVARVHSKLLRGVAMKNEDIPALIRELRQRLDLTQEQFAQKVGVTYSTVNHWENGKRVPLPFLVKRLVEMKRELDSRRHEGKKSPK